MTEPFGRKIDSAAALRAAWRERNKMLARLPRWCIKGLRRDKIKEVVSGENFHIWRDMLRFGVEYWVVVDAHLGIALTNKVEQDATLHISKHDGKAFVAFAETTEKCRRDIFTRMKFGKYLTKYHPEIENEVIKRLVAEFEYAHGEPPAVKFGETPEEFVHAIKGGPSDSCQADSFYSSGKFWFYGHAHPAVCYASGDIQVAWLENCAGEVTARTLINKAKKHHSRTYGDVDRLDRQLADLGYEKMSGALVGCRLVCIQNLKGDGWLMPYVDAGASSGGGSLWAVRTGDGHWMLNNDEEGVNTYCGYEKNGVTDTDENEDEEPEYGHCDRCGDGLHYDDDVVYSEHHGVSYCTSCADRHWVCAIVNVRGHGHYNYDHINSNSCTHIECLDEWVLDSVLSELDVVHDSRRDEWISLDDAVTCVWDDEYYHQDDCAAVGENSDGTIYIHEDNLNSPALAGKIYYDGEGKPLWYESDEIVDWLESGNEPDKYTLWQVSRVEKTVEAGATLDPVGEMQYRQLIERVRKIDSVAAEYMEGPGREQERCNPRADLSEVMVWSETPQGYEYWADIDRKIRATPPEPEKETWQKVYRWMQGLGIAFDFVNRHSDDTLETNWAQMECGFDDTAEPRQYRIRPGQVEPATWRETMLEAQRRGVKFEALNVSSTRWGSCGPMLFNGEKLDNYRIQTEKEEVPV